MHFDFSKIDKTWTLFLDRDGVINTEIKGSYVNQPSEFIFLDGALEAIKILSKVFGLIFVVTNQRGISKGFMTLDDLQQVHKYMLQEIQKNKGRIDKIYFCADLDDESPNRKPNPGMALQAQKEFPQIDLAKSIMAGNKMSDMQFARNAEMHSVFIASTNPETIFPHAHIDARFNSLIEFAQAIAD
ncbi:MAG: HAD family hydrolase [Bacteroidetes bacterium]|nr:HAD family hydrolase [Bacteroidota bacterium]